MVTLATLWLPIVVSGSFVFVASSILWMVLPFHKSDYRGLPDREDPGFKKKQEEGPVGSLILRPNGPYNMTSSLVLSLLYNLGVAGTVTILAYCGAQFYPSIWMGRPWSVTFKDLADGVIYGLLTAGTFGWLWPG
jgi:hypothetical protein